MPRAKYERRTVHLRALLVLLLGGGVLAGTLYLTHQLQVWRNAQSLLAQADHAEAEEQLAQAADYIWQYLGLIRRGDEADRAFTRYALLVERQAKAPRQRLRALFLLEQALRRSKGDRPDVRRQAARVAVGLGLVKEAQHHLEELRKQGDKDDSLLLLEARVAARTKEFEPALDAYARYTAKAPGDQEAWQESLEVASRGLKSAEKAQDVVSQMLRANPRSAEAREAAARYYLRAGLPDQADEQARFALETLGVKSEKVLLLAADAARARGQDEEASRRLSRALELHPKSAAIRLAAARLEAAARRRSEALNLLEPLRRDPPASIDERWELGSLLADLGDTAGAEEVLRRLSGPEADLARRLLQGLVHLRKKEFGEARLMLEKLRLERLPVEALGRHMDLMLADCYLALGIFEQAAEACRRAMAADPSDRFGQAARARLGEALAVSGKADQAIAEFRQLGDQGQAVRLRQSRLLLLKQLGLPEKDRDWKELEKALDEFPADQRDHVEVVLTRAQMLLARGQHDAARRLAEAARDRAPTEVSPWMFLAELARVEGKPQEALAVVQEAERRTGRKVEWELLRVRNLTVAGGPDARQKLQAIGSGLGRWSGDDHDRLLAALGGALGQVGDPAGAEKVWREVAQRQPRNLPVRLLLLDGAAQAGRGDEVAGLVREIEKAEGEGGPTGSYARAVSCSLAARGGDRAALAEARQHLSRAGSRRPNWDRVASLEGDLELLQGRKEAAAQKYRTAIERGEGRLAVWRRAAHVYFDLRQYGEAEALLRRLPEQARMAGDFGRMSATLALLDSEEGADPKVKQKQALEMARKVVEAGSGDYRDQLWLSRVAWLAGQRDEAEKAVRKAYQLAPNEPATLVSLISLLAQGDRDRARRELAEAERAGKAGRDALALMVCHEAVGQAKEAESYARQVEREGQPLALAQVAAFHARNGRAQQAEKLWRAILQPASKASEELRRGTRQVLAVQLALRQSYPAFQEALTLIDRNLESGNAPEDRRVKALVLATQPAQRAEAIKLFEGLSPLSPNAPPHLQFLLAQLYERDQKWPQARACLLAVARGEGKTRFYLAQAVRALLKHQDTEEAGHLLDELARLDGQGFETVELRARWLHATGKKDEARQLLLGAADKKDDLLGPAALTLEGLGEDDAAEKLLRRLAAKPKQPTASLLLARHLARRQRTAEALQACDQAEGQLPDEALAATRVAVLRLGHAGRPLLDAVAEKVAAALRKAPGSAVLHLAMAEVEDLLGRYDRVVEHYRQALRADPNNVVALNNLSYFLALKQGEQDAALKLIDQLLQAQGPQAEILDTRGLVHLTAGRHELAVKDFQAATRQDPTAGVKHFHLAQAQQAAGDLGAARSSWRSALQKGLKEESLHPLERQAYRAVAAELGEQ